MSTTAVTTATEVDEYSRILNDESSEESTCVTTVQRKGNACVSVICSRLFLKSLLLGQFLSILLCGTAVSTGLLQEEGVNIPTAQSFLNYVLLCVVFGIIMACRSGGRSILECLKSWWWRYLLISIVDVEANFVMVKAYAYTTVTSVQLLDCFSIVTVMILSCLVLHARYRVLHIVGAGICLLGMTGLVLTDILVDKNVNKANNIILGDLLCILGATLYGVSNVCEEFVVRKFDKVEFLAMLGFFGSFINGIQFAVLERNEVSSLDLTSYKTIVPLIVFVICQFLFYSTMTVIIQLTSATTVNLSILSADFYTLLFGLFLFNYKFHILYFVSFAVIIVGLAVYSVRPAVPPTSENLPVLSSDSQDSGSNNKQLDSTAHLQDVPDKSQNSNR